jgi:hypothetical protein
MLIRFHSSALAIALSCSLLQRVKAMASDSAQRGINEDRSVEAEDPDAVRQLTELFVAVFWLRGIKAKRSEWNVFDRKTSLSHV